MNSALASPEQRKEILSRLVESLVGELEPLQRGHNEAVWLGNTTGEARYEEEGARLDTEIRTLFSRREPCRMLQELVAAGGVEDPLLQRQLVLLLNDHRAHQIPSQRIEEMVRLEKRLESRFNNFRASLDGRAVSDNQLRDILRGSDREDERRQAWNASKQIGAEVVEELVELVCLRNRAARELGFENHYAMMLELDELDERELFGLLEDLERGSRPWFETYKRDLDRALAGRFGLGVEELRPWHYADPFFQEAPATEVRIDHHFEGKSIERVAEGFFRAIGFEIRDLLDRSDLYERPGKSQHAFCLFVDRLEDIRVLCNLQPNQQWMSTMLHECGHAVYDQHIARGLPYVLRVPAHTLVTEASAMLFGRLSQNPAWLERHAGVSATEARGAGDALGRATRARLLVQTRWCLVMCHMERALYRDPGQDLASLWWDLVERFQGLRRPAGRVAPDWASKIHFSVAAVYYHNYVLGEMAASQLQRHLRREVLGEDSGSWERYVTSPEVGRFLRERVYRSGKSMDWRDTIRHATGGPLGAAAFVDDLAGRG